MTDEVCISLVEVQRWNKKSIAFRLGPTLPFHLRKSR